MEELKQRISNASRHIPLERLGLSPQCGFSSSILGNTISFDDQHTKLKLVAKTARSVWG